MSDHPLREVAILFLKLGILGFGGPAAHISMMEEEVVRKRKWLSEQHFLDLIGATNLIPGPNSTEMAIHIGYEKAGWKGLLVAGICFILPAVFITGYFAFLYKKFGTLPEMQPFTYGIKPAIIAIILSALYPLAKKSIMAVDLAFIGIAVLILSFLKVNEIYLLFCTGLFAIVLHVYRKSDTKSIRFFWPILLQQNVFYQIEHVSNLNFFLDIFKDRIYTLWQWVCTLCFPGRRAGNYRHSIQTAVNRRNCSWPVYTRSHIFFCNFHRVPNYGMEGSSIGYCRCIFAFFCFCRNAKSYGKKDEKLGIVFFISECRQCSLGSNNYFCMLCHG